MKKILGFVLLGVGILISGVKGKQSINNDDARQIKACDISGKDVSNPNLSQEEEQREIQNRLKGLGYFQ